MSDRAAGASGPLVSIVLPTYNRAHLLRGALASCRAQTYGNLEIVVVDDGSTDDTAEVVREAAAADGRIRYVRQRNQRLPAALNTGHRAARGDYVTWSSDDNRYDPDAIAVMVEHLEAHREFGLVYCDYRWVDDRGEVIEVRKMLGPEALLEVNTVGACFLYRRAVYEAVGDYDPTAVLAEDYDYWIRVSRKFPVAHLAGRAPYAFMCHDAGLSARMRPEIEYQVARVRARYIDSASARRRILGDGHFSAAFWFRRRGRFGASLRHGVLSVLYRPLAGRHYLNLIALGRDVLRASTGPLLRPAGRAGG